MMIAARAENSRCLSPPDTPTSNSLPRAAEGYAFPLALRSCVSDSILDCDRLG
jgi:hypothetical protein